MANRALAIDVLWSGIMDDAGDPLSGGRVDFFDAYSTTPKYVYTHPDMGAGTEQYQVTLSASGRATVYGYGYYRLKIYDANGAFVRQIDGATYQVSTGTNTVNITADEWVTSPLTPTYVSTTSFTVPGDYTGTFVVGRAIRADNNGPIVYSFVDSVAYAASVTTVTLLDAVLSANLITVSYGLVNAGYANSSLPAQVARLDAPATVFEGSVTATGFTGNVTGNVTGNAATATNATNHIANVSNPHSVTYAQVGASPVGHDHDSAYTPIAHNTRTDNPHSVTYTQAGAAPLVHNHDSVYSATSHVHTNVYSPYGTLVEIAATNVTAGQTFQQIITSGYAAVMFALANASGTVHYATPSTASATASADVGNPTSHTHNIGYASGIYAYITKHTDGDIKLNVQNTTASTISFTARVRYWAI